MTAHPKIDPVTKEAFAFRYSLMPPYLTFFRFNKNGEKQVDVPIFSMARPSLLHDFAITKNYAIFPETRLGLSLVEMIRGGSPVSVDLEKVPRVGVIPRYAKDESEMKWFEVSGWNSLHVINAWEEDGGDTVVVVAPNILSVEHMLERMDLVHASMEKVTINLKTGMVPSFNRNLEFAVINPAFVAVKNSKGEICKTMLNFDANTKICTMLSLVYLLWSWRSIAKFSGVVKLDITLSEVGRQDCTVARRMFGPNCFGGEPFFVAREPDNPDADEDDGYIVSYVHNENTGKSSFLVMDAKSPMLDIIAVVKLPKRVPYGFHGLFIRESDIDKL
ncbi:LOW QUALITY PROTEIN: hypothetical protein OSB04_010952 [Centaurea solstitialis]|uniref:Uncharacterized protein n=1 Tax=Centaurea solstitialis TaxID=347529 RepID=A0AA38TG37_9ASTR|nr:LOW QUALITY PROTEIN: hypothetical protein OSB04_010952 [Centaurea solstitialis]